MTIMKRKALKKGNSEKETSEQNTIPKMTNLKKDNSDTDLAGQSGPANQVWSTRSVQPGPVN